MPAWILSSSSFDYLCKLDLDLDLPPGYFETLIERMEANPRIGTCSGKPYMRVGALVSERRGDEMSAGMTKFYRVTPVSKDIGGFVREVMWDAIDCHKARQKGWIAISWDEPDLRFEHLRPMGSSQTSIHTGRSAARIRAVLHGFGPDLLCRQLRLPDDRAALRDGGAFDALGLYSSRAATHTPARRCRLAPLHPSLPAPGADRG
jgi:hypothetical protein